MPSNDDFGDEVSVFELRDLEDSERTRDSAREPGDLFVCQPS